MSQAVQFGIATRSQAVVESVRYDAVKFMQELDEAIAFAKQTDQATALVRAIELRGRYAGLLKDKVEMSGSAFTLVLDLGKPQQGETIDVTPEESSND